MQLCDKLPASFVAGCKLFASWGWKRGDPPSVKFRAVPCPPAFVKHVGSVFGPKGPLDTSPSGLISPTMSPSILSPPAANPSASSDEWDPRVMQMTHYWDCSGQACDAPVLQPWDKSKYVSSPGYGPQNPADFGGSVYGEKMWLTGAASDALSQLAGPDDGCCGTDRDGGGGCGKCLLVQNPDALHADWTAIVMKKNRCPPWSAGCGSSTPHFDVAAPGFDNLKYSTANICGQPGTGFNDQKQSESVGNWWSECQNTAECMQLCDKLPASFVAGCKLFASWGWKRGDPPSVKFRAVPCPPAFVKHVGSVFGPKGPLSKSTQPSGPKDTPSPDPSLSPPDQPMSSDMPQAGCAKLWEQCAGDDFQGPTCCEHGNRCNIQNEWYGQCVPS